VGDSFVEFVAAQLDGLEGLACLAMFGGHGVYRGRTLVGIVSGGRLYFRTDPASAAEYVRRGMTPFRADREALRRFFEVPADVIVDRERLAQWARAASRSAAAPRPSPGAAITWQPPGDPTTSPPDRSTSW